jgi:hypothetical protein
MLSDGVDCESEHAPRDQPKSPSYHPNGSGAQKLLPYVGRYANGPQDPQPLQSVLIRGGNVAVWSVSDNDVNGHDYDYPTVLSETRTARVVLSLTDVKPVNQTLNAAMAVLPLDSLVTLTAYHTRFGEKFWLCYAQRWPLLQRVPPAPPRHLRRVDSQRPFCETTVVARPTALVADKTRPDWRYFKCPQDTPSMRCTYEARGARGSIGDS